MSLRPRVCASARRAARRRRSPPPVPARSLAPLLTLAAALLAGPALGASPDRGPDVPPARPRPAARIVSLNPSLTAILEALGARDRIVGIDDWSARTSPELADRPRVGGLYNPSLEGVVALEPDLVVVVPSLEQRDFRERLESMGVRVEVFANLSRRQVLENISRLGALVGKQDRARARIAAIRRTWRAVDRALEGRRPIGAVVVLQRDPLFVAGAAGFLDEMLRAAGAENLGARAGDGYPRVSDEWLVATAPEVVIDTSPEPGDGRAYYARYPSLPAVRADRVVRLDAASFSLPGPRLDRSLLALVEALHGPELRARIEGELAAEGDGDREARSPRPAPERDDDRAPGTASQPPEPSASRPGPEARP